MSGDGVRIMRAGIEGAPDSRLVEEYIRPLLDSLCGNDTARAPWHLTPGIFERAQAGDAGGHVRARGHRDWAARIVRCDRDAVRGGDLRDCQRGPDAAA